LAFCVPQRLTNFWTQMLRRGVLFTPFIIRNEYKKNSDEVEIFQVTKLVM
jgi:hypothetical protein